MAWSVGAGLEGKGVIVTGAAGGIGRTVAEAFATTGARVMAVDLTQDGVEAVVAGLGLWNAHLTTRVRAAERRQADTADLLAAVSHPQSHVVTLEAESGALATTLAASYVPGRPTLYLFGSLPEPAEGRVYKIWLLRGGIAYAAGVFRPDAGFVLLRLGVDPRRFDELLITEESRPEAARPTGRHVVRGTFG